MKRGTKIGITALTSGLLLALAAAAGMMYHRYTDEQQKVKDLEQQLVALTNSEKRSSVMQSINAQMEEIADQQRIISDEQRIAAEEQSKIAQDMQQHAELERRNAQEAEHRALEASELAKSQQLIAEQQRNQAEHSKRIADTLTYIAMARNVGNAAITQYNAGYKREAALLAYAAYIFTKRYHGDLYHPSVYQALSLASGSTRKWAVAHGSIMRTFGVPGRNEFVSISTYGEILRHTMTNKVKTKALFTNNFYDFRDIYINARGTCYAVSHTGHLVVIPKEGQTQEVAIPGVIHPFRIYSFKDNELLITAEKSVVLMDATTLKVTKTLPLGFKTGTAGTLPQQRIALFDQSGKMYSVPADLSQVKNHPLPFKGRVMSYNYHKKSGMQAFGMYDGTVNILSGDGKQQKLRKLVSHHSRVSRLNFKGSRLYTSSYDGTIKFWNIEQEKIEPIDILDIHQWVVCFSFDTTEQYVWTGDQNGNLYQTLISIPEMAQRIQSRMIRDLTREEWNYYIGKNIPYETFMGKEVQP